MSKLYMSVAAMVSALLNEVELLVLAIPEVLTESGIVSTCAFNGDTYCYDCLCNYHNQTGQHKLSLGGAKEILKSLF